MSLVVEIEKKMDGFTLSLAFETGEGRTGILGESGCGKSLTLKCIAGIEKPDSGRIIIDGVTVFDSVKRINVPPQRRRAGYLFQNYALFPTLTVEGNIGIALRGLSGAEKKSRIGEVLARMKLDGLAGRYPSQLSGGQQQRVALARMLAAKPRIVMLDEPFSALDSFLRSQMENELSSSLSGFEGSVLFVSHNRDEVWRFCDRLAVLEGGSLAALGDKREIFRNPVTVAAARLTGCKNIAPAFRAGDRRISVPSWGMTLETADPVPPSLTHAGIRSHHIVPAIESDLSNVFPFRLERISESPFSLTEYISVGEGYDTLCRVVEGTDNQEGVAGDSGPFTLRLPPEHLLLLRGPESDPLTIRR